MDYKKIKYKKMNFFNNCDLQFLRKIKLKTVFKTLLWPHPHKPVAAIA